MNLKRLASKVLDRLANYLPAAWRLPVRYYAWAVSGQMEPELVYLFRLCPRFGCAVDVGANHGYFSYKMVQRFREVHAYEANPAVDFDIRHYRKPNLYFAPFGLSDKNTTAQLRVPVRNGVPYIGWASIEQRELPFAESYQEIPVEIRRLDDEPWVQQTRIDLIKIDVEGHELEVLNGARKTIERDRPVLIIEDNEQQSTAIRQLLEGLGYEQQDIARFTGRLMASPNRIYTPR